MQLFAVVALLFSAFALAAPPSDLASRGNICPDGLFSNPECCSTLVLGTVGLDCTPPGRVPKNAMDFKEVCASIRKQARCCLLSVAGQGVLCQTPVQAN
ncbi:fungal hydrophobin-domain-containing protein [Mycena capillaripes]|nr:fungal hydrophobin-domain-containing protein [Mycena capillaripes]